MVVVVATKFTVKHQGKDIHNSPSIFFFISLVDPMPFPFPELHNHLQFSDSDCNYDDIIVRDGDKRNLTRKFDGG